MQGVDLGLGPLSSALRSSGGIMGAEGVIFQWREARGVIITLLYRRADITLWVDIGFNITPSVLFTMGNMQMNFY